MPKHPSDPPPRLLTIKEVASLLQVSDKTVRRLIEREELPAMKLGAQWRIDPRDLDRALHDRRTW